MSDPVDRARLADGSLAVDVELDQSSTSDASQERADDADRSAGIDSESHIRGPATEDPHPHEGSFAAGQALGEHHPERLGERGSFAMGQAQSKHHHQGNFAEGQQAADLNPQRLEFRGDFAAGQRSVGFRPSARR